MANDSAGGEGRVPSIRDDVDADAVQGDGRHETEAQRLDRNWGSLVQELRVTQAGTQILTGFLLTLAFQTRFQSLDAAETTVYLTLVVLATLTTALGLTPVALHRVLFRRHAMEQLVSATNVIMHVTLIGVGLILTGTMLFIFWVVLNAAAGIIAGAAALVGAFALWLILPEALRPMNRRRKAVRGDAGHPDAGDGGQHP
jgi:hypothetical protein